ncbi:acetyltransferase, partial [Salmonella enterica subsp. enterica serovar Typhimurium]
DDSAQWSLQILGRPVLGSIDTAVLAGSALICGVGGPALKARFVARAEARGSTHFASLVAPGAHVGLENVVGAGTVLCTGAVITTHVNVGRHVTVNLNCTIGHDAVVGDFCTLAPGVHLSGNSQLGAGTELGTGAV